MTAARRTRYNFGLQYAAELAVQLGKPLLVVEALRCDYPDACDSLSSVRHRRHARQCARLERYARALLPVCRAWPASGLGADRHARRRRRRCGHGLVSLVLPASHDCGARGAGGGARGSHRLHRASFQSPVTGARFRPRADIAHSCSATSETISATSPSKIPRHLLADLPSIARSTASRAHRAGLR